MKNLFEPGAVREIQSRLGILRPDSPRLWGTMSPGQALAHCSVSLESALGDRRPPRMMIGRLLGWVIKPLALGNEEPMRRNSPTVPSFVVADERNFETERQRLEGLISRFVTAGPAGCTAHPHSFFGRLSPQEWAVLMYKHLDHHLRQFGA